MTDLTTYSEHELVEALWDKGCELEYIEAAYYAMTENRYARNDRMFGNGEEGHHGADKVKVADVEIEQTDSH